MVKKRRPKYKPSPKNLAANLLQNNGAFLYLEFGRQFYFKFKIKNRIDYIIIDTSYQGADKHPTGLVSARGRALKKSPRASRF